MDEKSTIALQNKSLKHEATEHVLNKYDFLAYKYDLHFLLGK